MSARSMLRRFVGVAALTTVGLASTPFVGVAAAIGDPTTFVPAAATTTGKRPVVSATYAAALEPSDALSNLKVYSVADGIATTVPGTMSFSNGNKTMTLALGADLTSAKSPYEVRATAVPASGSADPVVNTKTWQFTVDSVAPVVPTVTLNPARTNGVLSVSGVTEPNVAVTVDVARTDAPNTKVSGGTTAGSTGAYGVPNLDVSGFTDGNLVVTVLARDAHGNSSTGTATGVKDTVAPVRVTTFPADQRTAQTRNTVVVTFDEALRTTASSLTVKNGVGSTLAGVTAFSDGDKTMTFTTASNLTPGGGVYSIVANATDVAGNNARTTTTFTIDDVAPGAPSVTLTDPINLANRAAAVVSGTAEPGSRVDVQVDDGVPGSPALGSGAAEATTGAYSIVVNVTALADGDVKALATATDGAQNTGASATSAVSKKDTVAPAAPTADMTSPIPATRATTVSGTAEPGSKVVVSVDDAGDAATAPVTAETVAGGTGAYAASLTLTGLNDGTVTATVRAVDAAGNPSAAQTDTATLDTGLPDRPTLSMPVVNNANKGAVAATGVAEPGALVTVTVDDGVRPVKSASTSAGSNGAYSTTFDTSDLTDGTLTVTATAKDGAGNASEPKTIQVVRDTAVPAAPALVMPEYVNAANKAAVELSGTAEAGSTVALVVSDTSTTTADVVGSVVTDPTGTWAKTLNLSSLADTTLTAVATAKDAAGNESAPRQTASVKDVVAPAAPSVSLTDPINPGNVASAAVSGSTPTAATVSVSVNDTDAATAAVTGGGPATGDGTFNVPVDLSALSDGAITATVVAKDAAGNESAPGTSPASAKDTITLARVSITPANGATVRPPAAVSATFNEVLSTTQTTITLRDRTGALLAGTTAFTGGGRTVAFAPADTLADAASPYTVQVVAKDADGSDAATSTFSFSVDGTPPVQPTMTLPALVNAAGQAAVEVSGVAEKGSSVTVSVDDATAGSPVQQTAPADAATGAYAMTLDLSALADGPLSAEAVATDAVGNPSDARTATSTKDATAPAAPSVTLPEYVNDATKAEITVSGVAEPGSSVALSVDDSVAGAPLTGTVVADATSGAFSKAFDLSGFADGAVVAQAVATDAAGNRSDAGSDTATKDVVAPAAPTADLADTTTSGGKSLAGVTGTAEPGATVTASVDDATAGDPVATSALADATTGAYTVSVDVTSLADGALTASVTARDAAGNTSTATTDTATKDTAAPAKPSISLPQYVNLANQAAVPVSGVADPGSAVDVSVGDESAATPAVTTTVTADPATGEYSVPMNLGSLADGPLTARAVAKDGPGNPSDAAVATASKDTVAPAAPTVTVPKVNGDNKGGVTVSGVAEGRSDVVVSIDAATPGDAVTGAARAADDTGAYDLVLDLTAIADGVVTATAKATDAAGNTSAAGTGSTAKDTVAPAAPTAAMTNAVRAANKSTVVVSGVAEPGSLVRISISDPTPGATSGAEATADAVTGEYSVTMEVTFLDDGVLTARVTAADAFGNMSPPVTATATKDTGLPAVPVLTSPAAVTRATRAAAPFAGTADPGSAIAISVDDYDDATSPVTGAAVAASDGAWSVALDVTSLKDGQLSIAVTATDTLGNTSGTTNGVVSKNVTRAFTVSVPAAPVSGTAQAVTVTAHTTYLLDSPADTSFTGTPALTSLDGHFTAGSCSAAVDGVATCAGTVFGDLGLQTLRATSGSGEDLVEGAATAVVQPTGLAFVNPPGTADDTMRATFTVVPTAGVEGASIAGYSATRKVATTGGATIPNNGSALHCSRATCTFTVKFLSRGTKTVSVTDDGTPARSTGATTVVLPYATALSLSRSALTVPAGGYVTLSGKLLNTDTLAGVGGATLMIYRKTAPGTTYVLYTTDTTETDGRWLKRVPLRRNTSYYARFAGDATHLAVDSAARLVKASQVVTSAWSASGRTVSVYGGISPNASGRSVYLQYRRSDGTWAYAGAVTTATGTSRYALKKSFPGPRVLRVAVSATSLNAAGFSKTYVLK